MSAGLSNELIRKEQMLKEILRSLGSSIVAFSGGVDSAYLAVACRDALGSSALAVTAESPSYAARQKDIALEVVRRFGLRHEFIASREMENPDYAANPLNRCYFCKHELYGRLAEMARERGFASIVDGNNLDDTTDYRPGRIAASEHSVRSPFVEAGLRKNEIRALSRAGGLPTWDLPSSPCLSSRIPYGSAVTEEKLRMIEQAEELLRGLGFPGSRVRHHGDIARIEIPGERLRAFLKPEVFDQVVAGLRGLGFRYVTLDLETYRSGRLNEAHEIAIGER